MVSSGVGTRATDFFEEVLPDICWDWRPFMKTLAAGNLQQKRLLQKPLMASNGESCPQSLQQGGK